MHTTLSARWGLRSSGVFTSIADCVTAAGPRRGAGENVAYTQKAGANFTAVLSYLAQHRVGFLGQVKGARFAGGGHHPPTSGARL